MIQTCFLGWYHAQFSALIFVQIMPENSLTSLGGYGNIHHAKRQKQRKLEEKTMWTEGTIQVGTSTFHYWVKHYEEPSTFGYEEGRASKISLRRNGKTVFNFDRGMDIPPEDEETETALAILLKQYNWFFQNRIPQAEAERLWRSYTWFLFVYGTQETVEISAFFLFIYPLAIFAFVW